MYNIRIKRFAGSGVQISLYSTLVEEKDKGEKKKPREKEHEWLFNPFTGEMWDSLEDKNKSESLRVSYIRTINSIYDIARCNTWDWFFTFTFAPDKVKDRYDYAELSKVMSQWLRNIHKRKCPDMVYLVVPEQHKDGAWHFHGLFANCEGLTMVDSGKQDDKSRPIYNIHDFKLGFTTATAVGDSAKACSYLVKYITKELCAATPNMRRYWASRNCVRPVEEFCILEGDYMEKLQKLMVDSKHYKSVENEYQKVTYFEYSELPEKIAGEFYNYSQNCISIFAKTQCERLGE